MGKKNLVKKLVAAGGLAGAIAMSQGCATSSGMNYDNKSDSYIGFRVTVPLGGDKKTFFEGSKYTLTAAQRDYKGNVAGLDMALSRNTDYKVDSFAMKNNGLASKTNFNINLFSGMENSSFYSNRRVLQRDVITSRLYSNDQKESALVNYNAATGETSFNAQHAVLAGIAAVGAVAVLSNGSGSKPKPVVPEPTPEPVVPEPTPEPVVPEPTPEPVVPEPTPEPVVPEPTPEPTPGDGGGDGGSIN